MKVRILGTGTSTGVPIPGCLCEVCTSKNPKNNRLRCSVHIEYIDAASNPYSLLIDTSTDLRQQALRANLNCIDAVLFTHTHADHVHGIDDLRSFNFINNTNIDLYAIKASADELESKFRYCFHKDPVYEGGAPPRLRLHRFEPNEALTLGNREIVPLPVRHGSLEVMGYRSENFAYITDCSEIPPATKELLKNVEIVVLDGLRNRPHKTHFTIDQAIAELEQIAPKRAYLTHISHELEHEQTNQELKAKSSIPIELAYDCLEFVL